MGGERTGSQQETPFDMEAHFVAEFEHSDADLFDLIEVSSVEQEKDQTRAQVIEYFGEQEFEYDGRRGTASLILDVCPPVRELLASGVEAIINFIEPYKVVAEKRPNDDETESDKEEDPLELFIKPQPEKEAEAEHEEKVVAESAVVEDTAKAADQPSVEVEVEKTSEAEEAPAQEQEKATQEQPETLKKFEKSARPERPERPVRSEKPKELEVSSQIEAPLPVEAEVEVVIEPEPAEVRFEENDVIVPIRVEGERGEEYAEPLPKREADVVLVEPEPAQPEISVLERVVLHEQESEREQEEVKVPNESTPSYTEEALEEHGEIEIEVETETEGEQYEAGNNYIKQWAEVAAQQVPIEVLFEKMTDDIVAAIDLELEHFDADDDVLDLEERLAPDDDLVEEGEEGLGDVEKDEALLPHPKLQALLGAVESVRENIQNLYEANTRHECSMYVEHITVELTVILRGLGYQNPEVIVRAYLRTHSPEQLKYLIEQLEAALRKAVQHNVARTRVHKNHTRNTRVGKFVTFVMGALNLRTGEYLDVA